MLIITLLIVLGTTIWVGFDAQKNQVSTTGSKPYSLNTGVVVWVGFCLLLWIITFPCYLYRRNKVLSARRAALAPAVHTSAVSPVPASAPTVDIDQQLRQLAKLKDDGIITAEDFDRKKKILLGF